jgi:hypothetical protein
MANLLMAHNELFRRAPDECFESLDTLYRHCRDLRSASTDRWQRPQTLLPQMTDGELALALDDAPDCRLNDWSFSQLCRMAGVNKETLNRLSPQTAGLALRETLPSGDKPLQLLHTGNLIRSVHGVSYTRLWNADLLEMVRDTALDFQPPQTGVTGGTGLYCGEQDMFCFLIDPLGWTEIGGEAFAPGFFLWNSEVGRRSVGIQTFWFQAVCQNHIVWDAVEVCEFKRKHTANVRDGLLEIRQIIDDLVAKRDARRDGFATALAKAMREKLGDDADEVMKVLAQHEIPRNLAKQALDMAERQGAFTIFSVVDALTRLTQSIRYAGDRVEIDAKVGTLLALAV